MSRIVTIGAAQMGPIARTESRASVVRRQIELMRQAKAMGADVVAYPEAALTAFFPHWWTEDEAEVVDRSWCGKVSPRGGPTEVGTHRQAAL